MAAKDIDQEAYVRGESPTLRGRQTIGETPVLENPRSSDSEAAEDDPLPGIEGLQITGEPFPGNKIQACGYSINGTTSCIFEWVRYQEYGSVVYVEGAKGPDYLVTADDVGLYLAVEVQPMDERGRKGELCKVFANNHRKITCAAEDDPLPGIEGLQITGEALPGNEIQACGSSINGTTRCYFKWVRYQEYGLVVYVEGAEVPDYLVTADDVGSCLAVEVQPMDQRGRKGELSKVFANNHRKITFDHLMEEKINAILSLGHASFDLLARIHGNWESATLAIKRDSYGIKCNKPRSIVVMEKFLHTSAILIPYGQRDDFIICSASGGDYLLRTMYSNCSRDTIVHTMRLFKSRVMERSEPGETTEKHIEEKVASIKLEEQNKADKKLHEPTMQPVPLPNRDKNDTNTNMVATFSYSDLQLATSDFSESNKLGQGGFGKVYKGNLLGNEVAIKILLSPGDLHQQMAFHQEINILCKLNHPHLVRLIGACPEKCALVYEFVPGGTLEARIVSNALPWQDRIRIATEICYALMFLHSLKPEFVVHGDLKPENVLLDANGKVKLGDFGICRLIPVSNTTTTAHRTTLTVQGSAGYLDPIFIQSGRRTPSIDVYAFGMVLLRLLTNKKAGYQLIEEVEDAMGQQCLDKVLDTAIKWPSHVAPELASLATRCCHYRVRERPNLAHEVCKKLEQMKEESSA